MKKTFEFNIPISHASYKVVSSFNSKKMKTRWLL